MPPPDAPPLTRIVVLRAVGFGVAIALGAVAVWLIVIADSTKSVQLGVLAGIWGALLGAFSMFGARRHGLESEDTPAQSRSVSDVPVMTAQEIAMRTPGEVERIAEAAARRAFEDRLEQMMRREISREVGDLRGEIARLRQDLLDKVGGQLRLERIETTRVIGSDLEALQHEVRQLKQASETGTLHELGIGTLPKRMVVEPARVRPVSRPADEAAADVQPGTADQPSPTAEGPADPVDMEPPARPAANLGGSPNGASGHGGSSNGVSPNGAANTNNGAASSGAANNGAANNGAANNGAASNGAASNGAARPQTPRAAAPAPAPAETTGPIRLQPPADSGRPPRSAADAPAGKPQAPTPKPADTWSPPPAPTRVTPAAVATPPTSVPSRAATPPSAPAAPPAPAANAAPPVTPPASAPPSSSDPFASLPRITPFTEFELDPVDTAAARTRPEPPDARPAAQASPVAPASSAYTGRRRRTDGSEPDAGRHSRHDAPPPPQPVAPGGRRRRADEDDDTDDGDLLSRLLARGSADR